VHRARGAACPGQTPSRPVTILHLSDTQFGEHHHFGVGTDSLASRLIEDLTSLGPVVPGIDLVVLSGDITERALPSEFLLADTFLREMNQHLRLAKDRYVMVPGNHDVNRALCRAYFAECAGIEAPLEEPFARKWEPYLDFASRFYEAARTATDQFHDYPELSVVVAALDSTQRESHRDEDHYGFCGQPQLRKFEGHLADRQDRVRIAVVHHNVRRKAEDDEENLRDEDDLTRILGPHLDLVLHGHTHSGARDHLADGTLVLSTGSAALGQHRRPFEVPNQYQIIRISDGAIERWARRYEIDQKRWTPDARVGFESAPGFERFSLPAASLAGEGTRAWPIGPAESTSVASIAHPDFLSNPARRRDIDYGEVERFRADLRADSAASRLAHLTADEFLNRLGLMNGSEATLAAVLLFGSNPQAELPLATVKCVRYFGVNIYAERQPLDVPGGARHQVDKAHEFLRERVPRPEKPHGESARAAVEYGFPMTCVREILVNAIVHRDYSDRCREVHVRLFDDRIEIASPGQWMEVQLEPADTPLSQLAGQSVKRNPLLAKAMGLIMYFEGEGSGLPTALKDAAAVGAHEPSARYESGFVVVSVWPSANGKDPAGRKWWLETTRSHA
jgi:3',5'-cyclic AMP phosphodiesterase CpdA